MEPTYTPRIAPFFVVEDASGLIEFIEKGLGGKLTFVMRDEKGKVGHAEVHLSDGLVMIGERPEGRPTVTGMIHLYVIDAGVAHARAVGAGAVSVRDPTEAPEGGVRGGVRDRWGIEWWFTTPAHSA